MKSPLTATLHKQTPINKKGDIIYDLLQINFTYMKTKLFSIVMMFTAIAGYAQQDAQYTQYMYNTINVNPAYAGSRGALSFFALHRTQWVGLDGAPVSNTISVNTPFNNSKLGLGVSIVNDEIGPSTTNSISTDISYSIPVS
jgi:type IX secretion system PorP/SprF family membrane protein